MYIFAKEVLSFQFQTYLKLLYKTGNYLNKLYQFEHILQQYSCP